MLKLTFEKPVDFVALVAELRGAGLAMRQIAELSGLSRGAVVDYWLGRSQPSHLKGEALIRAWCKQTGRPTSEAPRSDDAILSASKVGREDRGPVDAFQSPCVAAATASLFAVTLAWATAPLAR